MLKYIAKTLILQWIKENYRANLKCTKVNIANCR